MKIVLYIVFPILFCIVDAKYSLLTVGQEWRFIIVSVVYGRGILSCCCGLIILLLHVMRKHEGGVSVRWIVRGVHVSVRLRLRYQVY